MSTPPQGARPGIEMAVERALAGFIPPGLIAGCRLIHAGDAQYLLPAENATIATRDPRARAASGAGRRVAHELLRRLGDGKRIGLLGAHRSLLSPAWRSGPTRTGSTA